MYDLLAMTFREIRLRRDPNCPLCGDNSTITELVNNEELCGLISPEPVGVGS